MSEYVRRADVSGDDPRPEPVKVIDEVYRYRGVWDREADGICRVRVFQRGEVAPVLVISEHPENRSGSVTNSMEFLACELIRDLMPERFEALEPTIILEHYAEQRDARGRIVHEETWDRVSFASWAPRRVWIGGQERLSFGAPEWRPLAREAVVALIGAEGITGREWR